MSNDQMPKMAEQVSVRLEPGEDFTREAEGVPGVFSATAQAVHLLAKNMEAQIERFNQTAQAVVEAMKILAAELEELDSEENDDE